MNDHLIATVLRRLASGGNLGDLGLGSVAGRLDLRGLGVPQNPAREVMTWRNMAINQRLPSLQMESGVWENLDLSESKLQRTLVFGCEFRNCIFDRCDLSEAGFWSSTFVGCSFKGAKMKGVVVSGVDDRGAARHTRRGLRCEYERCDFTSADMRGTVHKACRFADCAFDHTKLDRVDFQGSEFIRGRFAGPLKETMFYRFGFRGETWPPNEMAGVDMSRSELVIVAFRGISLSDTLLPTDEGHRVIESAGEKIDQMTKSLASDERPVARSLAVFLNADREWIPPGARRAIRLKDVEEYAGGEAVQVLLELLSG